MRKFLLALSAMLLGSVAWAQVGIVTGLTTSELEADAFGGFETATAFHSHIGLAYKIPLGLGFALQPEVLYNNKGTAVEGSRPPIHSIDLKMGYVEAGMQMQLGVDLLLARPYLFVEPFVGGAVRNFWRAKDLSGTEIGTRENDWGSLNKFGYGLGAGVGLDVADRLQLSVKFFWNGGSLCDLSELRLDDYWQFIGNIIKDGDHFNGLNVTLGLFF